ncbi:hypothetical protein C3L23_06085 [Nautilia sp. PV-1]|uniref:hypothetical protein n=1 Tax=Nautilia sp. PV-1 TaxID=2579250 RepID=UPI000FDBEF0D|nr:hypothetical protein [Nautilia sp. PV-1]AZV46855.1 hypothetical protein C3L23_06085 [Nautilia sp. PV-1]
MRREEVIQNIVSAVKDIASTYEWRVTPPEISELPLIIVRDTEDNIDSEKRSYSSEHELKIEIEYIEAGKELTVSDLREKLNEILQKIGENEAQISDYLALESVEIDLEQKEFIIGRGMIELKATYLTEKWGI